MLAWLSINLLCNATDVTICEINCRQAIFLYGLWCLINFKAQFLELVMLAISIWIR